MNKFEEFGRAIDREIEKLRELAQQKIKPETRLKAAHSLRSVSDALRRYADDIEAHAHAAADPEKPPEPETGSKP